MLDRLENLRKALVLGWSELAERLEISRAMLDFVKTGKRNPSPKLMRRIEQAEREAGISTPLDRLLESAKKTGDYHTPIAAYAAKDAENARLVREAAPEMKAMATAFERFAVEKFNSIEAELRAIRKTLGKKQNHRGTS